jgi:hypothetical protein
MHIVEDIGQEIAEAGERYDSSLGFGKVWLYLSERLASLGIINFSWKLN